MVRLRSTTSGIVVNSLRFVSRSKIILQSESASLLADVTSDSKILGIFVTNEFRFDEWESEPVPVLKPES